MENQILTTETKENPSGSAKPEGTICMSGSLSTHDNINNNIELEVGQIKNDHNHKITPTAMLKTWAKAIPLEPRIVKAVESKEDTKKERPNQKARLLEIAQRAYRYRTPEGESFIGIDLSGGGEAFYPVDSGNFKHWIKKIFFDQEEEIPSPQNLTDVIAMVETLALSDGETRPLYQRVANLGDAIYIDLGREDWRVIKIDKDGWRILDKSSIAFRRPRGMRPLPEPIYTGKGYKSYESRIPGYAKIFLEPLVFSWLLGCLCGGPYPIMALTGSPGTGKTTFANLLKAILDPGPGKRRPPKDERDLSVAVKNGFVASFDNISSIPSWLSDAFCGVATGGDFGTRALFTNLEECLVSAMRPLISNGVGYYITRPDLADRAIFFEMPEVEDSQALTDDQINADFQTGHPYILGLLFDAASEALRNLHEVKLAANYRMNTFAKFVLAAENSCPWPPGTFEKAYQANRKAAVFSALDSDPVLGALVGLMEKQETWQGTPTELLEKLNLETTESIRASGFWPKTPTAMGNRLSRGKGVLRKLGIIVEKSRTSDDRSYLIRKIK